MSNRAIGISGEGLHYAFFKSELPVLEDMAVKRYGKPLADLTIGRAATILTTATVALNMLSDTENVTPGLFDINTAEDDSTGLLPLDDEAVLKRRVRASITTIGRITVDILPVDLVSNLDAEPVSSIEILGQAYNRQSN